MRDRDMKFIKRWEKTRSNSKIKYALIRGVLIGTINFLVLLLPLILLGGYVPSETFSLVELVSFTVQEYNYYLFIAFIVFFVVHVIGAYITWERNENEYKKMIQENRTDEINGRSILSQKMKRIVNKSSSVIIIVLFIYLNKNSLPYMDSKILKTEVDNYLTKEYDVDFIVSDDITRNGAWYYVRCYPKTDMNTKFLVIWHKGKPEEATDTYIDSKLKYPDEIELKNYIEETYGNNTFINLEIHLTDTTNDMKDMENQEILEKYKDKLYINIECHTFIDELNQKEEIERAYHIIENYFKNTFGEWDLHIHYYSEKHKNELIKQYEDNSNFFRIIDTTTANKLHKEGQLINTFHVNQGIEKKEAIDHFYYQ